MNDITKTLRLNSNNPIYYIASAILPFTTNGTRNVNTVVLILLCLLLFTKIWISNFKIHLSKNVKNVVFTVVLFSLPALAVIWNKGYSAVQGEFIFYNFANAFPLLLVSIIFILINSDIRNRNHCFKALISFLFAFVSFSSFYIIEASRQYNLITIYLSYNTDNFKDFLSNPLLGDIGLGCWWDLTVSLPFLLLYMSVIFKINSKLIVMGSLVSFFVLLALGSRGALVLYVFNLILIAILNKNRRRIFNSKFIVNLILTVVILIVLFIFVYSFIDITQFSTFQRGGGDLTQDTGRFEMWSYFFENLDKLYLFSNSLSPIEISVQTSFHSFILDNAQFAGMLGIILGVSACIFMFKSSTTYLTKLISFTIVTSRLCGIPPFSNAYTYIVILSIYPILNRFSYQNDAQPF